MLNLVEKTEPVKKSEIEKSGKWEEIRIVCYLGNKERRFFSSFF